MFDSETSIILGCLAAIAATILLYIKVLPKKKDGRLGNGFFQFLHDFFHFKKLYLEEALKGVFTLATIACVSIGFFLLIGYEGYGRYKDSTFLYGLFTMVCGPVALRLVYEGLMMFVLLVKNVLEINNKLSSADKAIPEQAPAAPAVEPAVTEAAPETAACPQCGAAQDASNAFCWNCGSPMK